MEIFSRDHAIIKKKTLLYRIMKSNKEVKMDYSSTGFSTRAIHFGQDPDPTTGAVMIPINLSTTFVQSSPGVHKGYEYSRTANPTRTAYEKCLASLENAQYGFALSSGCSATHIVLNLLQIGDHVLAGDDLYGGTVRLFDQVMSSKGLKVSYADFTDLSQLESSVNSSTKLIWLETPTNPTLKIFDIKKIAAFTKAHNILLAVDNTFMSPYFQNPISLGADIVVHSTTKYVGGHSDVLGGAIVTHREDLAENLAFLTNSIGSVASPFDSYLALRSLKTLSLRMQAHQRNALEIANFLEEHPKVNRVVYPGHPTHPQHELAKEQMSGFGGMIAFFIQGGLEASRSFLENLKIFTLAESLGGVESLVEHPGIMTHSSVPEERRKKLGITDSLIRLSIGVEDCKDLTSDLEQAF